MTIGWEMVTDYQQIVLHLSSRQSTEQIFSLNVYSYHISAFGSGSPETEFLSLDVNCTISTFSHI
jgi:hypothetical protein